MVVAYVTKREYRNIERGIFLILYGQTCNVTEKINGTEQREEKVEIDGDSSIVYSFVVFQ